MSEQVKQASAALDEQRRQQNAREADLKAQLAEAKAKLKESSNL
jgi:hypothetical protein